MLLACKPNFAEVALITCKVEQACPVTCHVGAERVEIQICRYFKLGSNGGEWSTPHPNSRKVSWYPLYRRLGVGFAHPD